MTAKVVPIRGRDIVATLEDWLERARRGEIVALAFAAVLNEGDLCEGWAGDIDSCAVTLYGAINVMRDAYFHDRIDHYSTADQGLPT